MPIGACSSRMMTIMMTTMMTTNCGRLITTITTITTACRPPPLPPTHRHQRPQFHLPTSNPPSPCHHTPEHPPLESPLAPPPSSVVVGLVYNFFAALNGKGFGQPLPWFLDQPIEMLSRGFSPCVLFLAGAATFGSFTELGSVRSAALPALLVLLKSLVLPFCIRAVLHVARKSADEINFGFICNRRLV